MRDFDFKNLCEKVFRYKNMLCNPRMFENYIYYQDCVIVNNKNEIFLFRKNIITNEILTISNKDEIIWSPVNTYGGVCFCPVNDGVVYFDSKSKIIFYCKITNDNIEKINIYENKNLNHVEFCFDKFFNKIYFISEDNSEKQFVSQINLNNFEYKIVDQNYDFYNCLDANDGKVAFVCWNLPHMPWDKNNIVVLQQNDDVFINVSNDLILQKQNYFQPIISSKNVFYSSENEYFDLYKNKQIFAKFDADVFLPLWVFGMKMFYIRDDGGVIVCGIKNGTYELYKIVDNKIENISKFDQHVAEISSIHGFGNNTVFQVSYTNKKDSIWVLDKNFNFTKVIQQNDEQMGLIDITIPKSKTINLTNDFENYDVQYFEYIPKNFNGNIIVKSHGGPTGQTGCKFTPKLQIWTNLGFGVLDINYSGSTGFGKQHRKRLNGNYGEIEIFELNFIANMYKQDKNIKNIFISGSSSGGYDALMCGVGKDEIFDGVCCVYGIGDIKLLIENTHKFERNYFDVLLKKMDDEYLKRISPLYLIDPDNKTPFLLIHGDMDNVVDISQSTKMFAKMNKKICDFVKITGEGHGFKKFENVVYAITKEYEFYQKIINKNNNNN